MTRTFLMTCASMLGFVLGFVFAAPILMALLLMWCKVVFAFFGLE